MTTADGGVLIPSASDAPYDDALLDVLHDWIAAQTGLAADLVRPALEVEPANLPGADVSWCAFWAGNFKPDENAVLIPLTAATDGAAEFRRHETFDLRVTIYGPNAMGIVSQFRDGLQFSQNRFDLLAANIGVIDAGAPQFLAELVKGHWLRRADLTVVLKRGIIRTYGVMSLVGNTVATDNEHYITEVNLNE